MYKFFILLLHQFYKFLSTNWWIFLFFIIILVFTYGTSSGNISEIMVLFITNLFGNLCMMMMQDAYKDQKFFLGSSFLLIANITFLCIASYGFFVNQQIQYLLWQVSFFLSGTKLFFQDVFNISINWINTFLLVFIGICILVFLIFMVDIALYGFIQSLGFFCITTGLVLKNDIKRYYILFFGTFLVFLGSFLGIYKDYLLGNILGITVGYGFLSLVTLIFYIKVFPKYYSKFI